MQTRKLLIGTTNKGKIKELVNLFKDAPFEITTLIEEGISQNVDEVGDTLEENAILKAKAYAQLSGLLTLADDSGLEVEALGGEPGHLSARYAAGASTDQEKLDYLLHKLQDIPWDHRQARFRCIIALAWPPGEVQIHEGLCHGRILKEPRGVSGFGYDPIFYLPELDKSMAELSQEEKNQISHRGQAARKALESLKQYSKK